MSTFHQSGPDQTKVIRSLTTLLLFFITVIGAFYAVKTGSLVLMVGLVTLPFALILMRYPAFTLVAVAVLDATGMSVPGVSYTSLGFLGQIVFIASALLAILMGHGYKNRKSIDEKILLVFAGIVLVLMVVRGTGLRVLGSATWGGMIYVNLLFGIGFYILVRNRTLPSRYIYWVAWGSLFAGFVGALFQYRGWSSFIVEESVMASRLRWLTPLAYAILPVALAIGSRRKYWLSIILTLVGVGMFALTGDRKLMLYSFATIVGYGFFKVRYKTRYIMFVVFSGLLLWGALAVGVRHLPLGMQRTASILPGVEAEYKMGRDAAGSIEWRLEIWKYCIEQAPQYLLIGRGSAFDVWDTSANLGVRDIATHSPWFAFQTRSYHSGPLSLLIDYGLPGFITILLFVIIVCKKLWGNAVKLAEIDSFVARYVLALSVSLICTYGKFYFIMGAIPELAQLIGITSLVFVFYNSLVKQQPQDSKLLE